MRLTTRVAHTLAVGALTLTLGASLAAAQDALTPTAEPNFGSVPLSAGFSPDPFIMTVFSGGELDASTLGLDAACRGYVAPSPDFRVTWDGTSPQLRFFFTGEGDTTLIVSTPDGQTLCNDDGFGLDPLVEVLNPVAGDYNVWVGSYAEGEFVYGYLMVSGELASSNGSPIASQLLTDAVGTYRADDTTTTPTTDSLDPNVEPTFGDVTLAPGFTPDPYTVEVLSGGEVNVAMLSLGAECVGYAASEPDFTLNLSGALPQLTIGFTSQDEMDTTLIVRGPSGEYQCSDDMNGTDPELTLSNAAVGEYDIWVGTYLDDFSDGDLYISQGGGAPSNNNAVPTAAPNNGTTPVTGATSVPPVANATPEVTGK